MPGRSFRKKYYKKKTYKKRSTKWIASKKFVKKEIRKDIETKYFDFVLSSQPIDTTHSFYALSNVPQGVLDTNRIGDQITVRGLSMAYGVNAAEINRMRVTIIQWKPTSVLTIPAAGFIFQNIAPIVSIQSPFINDYHTNFTVLYDKVHTMVLDDSNSIRQIKKKLNIKYVKRKLQYVAGGTEHSGRLYLILVSDSGAVPHPGITFYSRLRYDDA